MAIDSFNRQHNILKVADYVNRVSDLIWFWFEQRLFTQSYEFLSFFCDSF